MVPLVVLDRDRSDAELFMVPRNRPLKMAFQDLHRPVTHRVSLHTGPYGAEAHVKGRMVVQNVSGTDAQAHARLKRIRHGVPAAFLSQNRPASRTPKPKPKTQARAAPSRLRHVTHPHPASTPSASSRSAASTSAASRSSPTRASQGSRSRSNTRVSHA